MTRAAAFCALGIGGGYVLTIALFAHVGAPPGSAEAWMTYLAGRTSWWWGILALSVATDFLFLPLALALFVLLEPVHRGAMLVATALVGVFIVLDIAVTWTSYASLIMLEGQYAAAASEAQKAAVVAAAGYPAAVLASPLVRVCSIVDLSAGFLVIGLVTIRAGLFKRATAYVGVATGVVGLIAITGSTVVIILNALLATAWVFLVGAGLLRISRHERSVERRPGHRRIADS